jgi:diacylglycerol O-acyltransferase
MFGPLFRVLAAVGAYRYYLRHQRRFHTIVSNLRGPSEVRTLAGSTVESIIPISVGELGNVAVTFVGLTYAGTLTITAIVDPAAFPDLPLLLSALQEELGADNAVR